MGKKAGQVRKRDGSFDRRGGGVHDTKMGEQADDMSTETAHNDHTTGGSTNISGVPFIRVKQRVHEQDTLLAYIRDFEENGKGSVIYISGVPGSGKTYTVINTLVHRSNTLYFNCGTLKNKKMFFRKLYNLANRKTMSGVTGYRSVRSKQQFTMHNLKAKLDKRILVIDELDFVLTKDQHVLYTLFELKVCALLVCISNTMAFTNRLDGKVASRIDFFINFEAYGAEEIREIVGVGKDDAFDLVVRRMAAVCGDVRRVEWYRRMLRRNGIECGSGTGTSGMESKSGSVSKGTACSGSTAMKGIGSGTTHDNASKSGNVGDGRRSTDDKAQACLKSEGDIKMIDQLMKNDKPVFKHFLNEIDEKKKKILKMDVIRYEEVCGMDYFEYERVIDELESMGLVVNGKAVLTRDEMDRS
ncbi:hypothetical protein VCUG_02132 [Vavraia culicis subsp. floridensis]|uniref:Origin recognition complex subunit 1 n=1 Tax=Vavraia culicis (isolate floridensis) TaxID=948595 RepID=L2GSX3_VAVCU|nr:uncharacterized protein VCUG_02132 [Vavraia culicis subsp. floridensis]ELA46368.1 hypothetical protein VCUG_02132 [Vavraia culicis subsp. floridensis]